MNRQGYIPHIKKAIAGKRVLDVGCCATYAKNNLKRHLEYAKSAGEIIGIDINTIFLLDGQQAHPELELYRVDATSVYEVGTFLPKVGQFDHVIATDILEHLDDPRHFLKNMHLFMTPKGRLYITVPNVKSPHWWAIWLGMIEVPTNDDHVCWYDIDHLSRTLGRNGLEIEEHFYCTDPRDKHMAKRLNLEWQEWMGRRLYVVVKKVGEE
ncbi:MAG: class I SAM-dependent methyltransferase [Candidatus Thorarchaeota archaeon]|jgi:SAM-dependent methyltransferase